MSGIVKSVKKVFKKVHKVMKKIVDPLDLVGKLKSAIKKNKFLRVIVMAAAIYFTAGVAAAYFAAPAAGLGAAMSSTATTMWTGVTSAFSSAGSALTGGGAGAGAGAAGGAGAGAGAAGGSAVATVAPLAGAGGVAVPITTMGTAAAPAASTGLVSGAMKAAGTVASKAGAAIKGAGTWAAANPGSAAIVAGGIGGGMQALAADRARKADEKAERGFGFFGMNQTGTQVDLPTGGLVGSVAAPTVETPTVQGQAPQADPRNVQMTQQELLEAQRQQYIQNPQFSRPYGTA